MAASFHHWESDPFFSAAEVVQDSVDRMESVFRLLLHEQSLVQGEHPDAKLLTSINYHRRDLATTLETAKWQIEDFEKAVNLSATTGKSRMGEEVTSRHKHFIAAISEQIRHVEKSLGDQSHGDFKRNTEWVNLNEQDRNGLAVFLSGGPVDYATQKGMEDSSIMTRFLDPVTTSSFNGSSNEIVEHKCEEIMNLNMNGRVHVDSNWGSINDNNLRKAGSHYARQSGFEAGGFLHGPACDRHAENGNWDLESNEIKDKSFFYNNQLRGLYSILCIFRFFRNLWSVYGNRVSRNFTKRLKDGEEQRHSPTCNDFSSAVKGHHIQMKLASAYSSFLGLWYQLFMRIVHSHGWLGTFITRYERCPCPIHLNRQSMKLILAILFALIILGILLSQLF